MERQCPFRPGYVAESVVEKDFAAIKETFDDDIFNPITVHPISNASSVRGHAAPVAPARDQSCLSVRIGSSRAARVAGIQAASRHAATITNRLAAYAMGSVT